MDKADRKTLSASNIIELIQRKAQAKASQFV